MSAVIYNKHSDATAMEAAKLRASGLTYSEIAAKTGVRVGSLSWVITKGQSLLKAKPQAPTTAPVEQDLTPLEAAIAAAPTTTPTSFKIDRNIPLPAMKIGRPCIYPLSAMQVGDSFLATSDNSRKSLSRVSNTVSHHRQRHEKDKTFACRTTPNGIRVWRTA